jgi:uncharacterized membrane protein (UPF0127 family)
MKTSVLRKNGDILVPTIEVAEHWHQRMRGLLGRTKIDDDSGMHIVPCNGIHTFFMKFPLDLVFLNRSLEVVKIERDVKPWRTVAGGRGAWSVVELAAGSMNGQLSVGDKITFETSARNGAKENGG